MKLLVELEWRHTPPPDDFLQQRLKRGIEGSIGNYLFPESVVRGWEVSVVTETVLVSRPVYHEMCGHLRKLEAANATNDEAMLRQVVAEVSWFLGTEEGSRMEEPLR